MRERYGSRFTDGGYQAPSTNSVALERGRPLRQLRWKIGTVDVDLALVPLLGGRPELFEIEYKTNDPVERTSVYNPCMIRGEELARRAFAMTAVELDAGRIPELVLTAPGTPLGP